MAKATVQRAYRTPNGELHTFKITTDLDRLDPAMFIKAIRSKQSTATLGYGTVTIVHTGKVEARREARK